MKLQPLKEAYKASAIPIFQVIQTKIIKMASKIPWPASNGTSPFVKMPVGDNVSDGHFQCGKMLLRVTSILEIVS